MPSWKTHLIIAAIFWGIAVAILWQQNIFRDALLILVSFPIALFGGILMDIDQQNSKANNLIEHGIASISFGLIAVYLLYMKEIVLLQAGAILLAFFVFIQLMKHRGHVHSLLFAFIVSIPFALINVWLFVIIFASVCSHLIADCEFKLF